MIQVEIAYARPDIQVILLVEVEEGCKVEKVIQQSGILQRFPEINLDQNKVGIFSKIVSLETVLQAGDRVEIYRPLLIDPKQARRTRAGIQKNR